MRHIADTIQPHSAARRGRARARVVAVDDGRARMLRVLRLMLPLVLLFFLALGQAASAHQSGSQHQPQSVQALSHHGMTASDMACCGDLSGDEDTRACLAQCLASCSYCAPLPLPTAFPDLAAISPLPAKAEPLHGAIASPHLRPPSLS